MNETLETILSRRSCKSYKPDAVPAELVDQIIEAGLYAASGMNMQSAIIVAVTDAETIHRLSQLNAKYDPKQRKDPFYGAPVVLNVLADKRIYTSINDGSLVIGNMLLAAHSLGLGACWIHRAKEVFDEPEARDILCRLGISNDYEGIGHCVVGYPAHMPQSAAQRRPGRVFRISVPPRRTG